VHQISLVPALLSVIFFPTLVYGADISVNLKEKTDYFTFDVNISGLEKSSCKDKTCYLQGMFTSVSGSPKYFGLTFGQNDWFPYTSSPEKDFIKSNFVPFDTNSEGSWSGIVRLSVDKSDSDYKGPGQYLVKIKRYTGESTSAATDDINQLTVELNEPTPSPAQTPSPTTTNSPTSTMTVTSTPSPAKTPTPSITKNPTSAPAISPTTQSKTTTPAPALSLSPTLIPTGLSASGGTENQPPDIHSNILGDSTDSAVTTQSAEINLFTATSSPSSNEENVVVRETKPTYYKYLVIIGVMVCIVSSVLLFFRYRRAKIYQ
jgi:hypothetical protein